MNKNHALAILEFIGKVVWGALVLNISALVFISLSVAMSIKINDERIVIIVTSVILLPFTAGATLAGFNLIRRKVREINFNFHSIYSSSLLNNKIRSTEFVPFALSCLLILSGFLSFVFDSGQIAVIIRIIFIMSSVLLIQYYLLLKNSSRGMQDETDRLLESKDSSKL